MGEGKVLQSNGVDTLTAYQFDTVIADSPTGVKFGFQNDKDRIVSPLITFINQSGSDMDTFMKIVIDTGTLSCPYNFEVSLVTYPTTLELSTTYYYVIEAYNALGRTGASSEVSITTTDINHTPQLEWNPISGADGYYIYRATSSEIYTDCLIADINEPTTGIYIDFGTVPTTGTPVSINTTGGASPTFGTPPLTGYGTSLNLEPVYKGQKKFFWIEVDAPITVSEEDNPRNCLMRISEIV